MSAQQFDALDWLCINTLRTLAIDAVERASSGHPGLPLGAAPMAYVLWQRHLRHHPEDPQWPNRDRFVLSAGHGSMLLYGLLHLTGYPLSLTELQRFRQVDSATPGHPESFMTPGVEATTGPLGQGAANAVGMAMAERALAHLYNRAGAAIVDHHTYALVSDGDLMEGISAEAASLAGHLRLGKLIYLYDDNRVSLDGPTPMAFSEDVGARYAAHGWHVQRVHAGDTDLEAIDNAIEAAKTETEKPSLIIVRTTIGYGAPTKQGTSAVHGAPLGPEELQRTKESLGWPYTEPFTIPQEALARFRQARARGEAQREQWQQTFDRWARSYPELAEDWERGQRGELAQGWDAEMPSWEVGAHLATRKASGQALNAIAPRVPQLLGGDADLSVSTNTGLKDFASFDGQSGSGRNIHYGVREHAMAAIANGMAYHGGLLPYTATFFCFSDYMRPAVRLAALSRLPVVHIWTHDSVWLGEDGPTHQPVEQLMALRAMPNLLVIRPADPQETAEAWRLALQHRDGPVGLVLTRQGVPQLDRSRGDADAGVYRGAYILSEAENASPRLILIATGSEVQLAVAAQTLLERQALPTRVVSMPCWELFDAQPPAYRDAVLPPAVTARLAIEAGVSLGWERYVGARGGVYGIDSYGASGPYKELLQSFGFSGEAIAAAARTLVA
mgnify:CR=1 FL=1